MAVIDHLVYAVPELGHAIDQVEASTGVRPVLGGSHEGVGTHNALVSMGACYLELIAPDPGQPDPTGARPFGIDDLDQPALAAFAVRPDSGDDIDALVARSIARGHDPGPVIAMTRTTTTGNVLRWRLTMPRADAGGLVPFVIDWGATPRPSDTVPGGLHVESFDVVDVGSPELDAAFDALGVHGVRITHSHTRQLAARIAGPAGSVTLSSDPRRHTGDDESGARRER